MMLLSNAENADQSDDAFNISTLMHAVCDSMNF